MKTRAIESLFARFGAGLSELGFDAMGEIIYAGAIPAPPQRNTDRKQKDIREGRIPQEDGDAHLSIKYSKAKDYTDPAAFNPVDLADPMSVYKNQMSIDRVHRFIRTWDASAASAHDCVRLPSFVSKTNTGAGIWADTAYRSKKNDAFLADCMFRSQIHRKKQKGRPMPAHRPTNARRSVIREPVEHVFATLSHRIGLVNPARARPKIGSANLGCNFIRRIGLRGEARPHEGNELLPTAQTGRQSALPGATGACTAAQGRIVKASNFRAWVAMGGVN